MNSERPDPVSLDLAALHRARLLDWLVSWRLDQMAEIGEGDEGAFGGGGGIPAPSGTESRPAFRDLVAPFDPDVRTGEIRLVPDRTADFLPRPLYFAVLDIWEDGQVVLAPFGPFDVPATPGELLLDREAAPLRVLCPWNARSVDRSVAQTSWRVDALREAELEAALAVFRHAVSGRPLPDAVIRTVGPPLYHPKDPRHEYIGREVALIGEALAGLEQSVGPSHHQPPSTERTNLDVFRRWVHESADLALAAGVATESSATRVVAVTQPRSTFLSGWRRGGPPPERFGRYYATLVLEPTADPTQGPGGATGQWELFGEDRNRLTGAEFSVFRTEDLLFVGRGRVSGEGRFATLEMADVDVLTTTRPEELALVIHVCR